MNTTPDWMHGGESDARPTESRGISVLGVIAWIAAMAAIADALFLAQRYLG